MLLIICAAIADLASTNYDSFQDAGSGNTGGGCTTQYIPGSNDLGNTPRTDLYFANFADNGEPGTYWSDCAEVYVPLTVSVASYHGPSVIQRTRVYNGALLAPTIRVKPGQTLMINLTNALPPQSPENLGTHNSFHRPHSTNVHTHGLHIGSTAPADSIYIDVPPGESYLYVYHIPADHMGGSLYATAARTPCDPRTLGPRCMCADACVSHRFWFALR